MVVRRMLGPVAAALALVAVLAAPAGARVERSGHPARVQTALADEMLTDVNRLRRSRGLRPLRSSPRLTAAATQHSEEMARVGYFSHDSANGGSFWQRVQRYYTSKNH